MFWYIDPVYLAIFVITIVISLAAQLFISSQYKKWSGVQNSAGLTGREVGYTIVNRTSLGGGYESANTAEVQRLGDLRDKGIISDQEFQAKRVQLQTTGDTRVNTSSIEFERVGGEMTDHYDPRSHTVRMSDGVADKPSVSAMAIVAHELGHAQQHENKSIFISMRNFLLPAVRVSPQIAYFCIFIGLIFNATGLFWLGIIFYAVMVLFSVLTLPVEIDASRRGLKLLEESGLMISDSDRQGSRRVLTAAASTYIAAAITAILQLLYYISIARRRS